jgi:hypothetical protein
MYFHRLIVAVALCLLLTGVAMAQTVPGSLTLKWGPADDRLFDRRGSAGVWPAAHRNRGASGGACLDQHEPDPGCSYRRPDPANDRSLTTVALIAGCAVLC